MSSPINNSVLIVDDIPTNIKVLFDILNQAGFRVSVAKNGLSVSKSTRNITKFDFIRCHDAWYGWI